MWDAQQEILQHKEHVFRIKLPKSAIIQMKILNRILETATMTPSTHPHSASPATTPAKNQGNPWGSTVAWVPSDRTPLTCLRKKKVGEDRRWEANPPVPSAAKSQYPDPFGWPNERKKRECWRISWCPPNASLPLKSENPIPHPHSKLIPFPWHPEFPSITPSGLTRNTRVSWPSSILPSSYSLRWNLSTSAKKKIDHGVDAWVEVCPLQISPLLTQQSPHRNTFAPNPVPKISSATTSTTKCGRMSTSGISTRRSELRSCWRWLHCHLQWHGGNQRQGVIPREMDTQGEVEGGLRKKAPKEKRTNQSVMIGKIPKEIQEKWVTFWVMIFFFRI